MNTCVKENSMKDRKLALEISGANFAAFGDTKRDYGIFNPGCIDGIKYARALEVISMMTDAEKLEVSEL